VFSFVDLHDAFGADLPDRFFIPAAAEVGRGHYNAYGNSLVAEVVYRSLSTMPGLSARLTKPDREMTAPPA